MHLPTALLFSNPVTSLPSIVSAAPAAPAVVMFAHRSHACGSRSQGSSFLEFSTWDPCQSSAVRSRLHTCTSAPSLQPHVSTTQVGTHADRSSATYNRSASTAPLVQRRPSLSGTPTVTFCSVHIHNVLAKKRDASTKAAATWVHAAAQC